MITFSIQKKRRVNKMEEDWEDWDYEEDWDSTEDDDYYPDNEEEDEW